MSGSAPDDRTPPPTAPSSSQATPASPQPPTGPITLRGVAASPGVVVGPALRFPPLARADAARPAGAAGAPGSTPAPPSSASETERARTALATAAAELRALVEQVSQRAGAEQAEIFEAQALMLEDPTLTDRVDELTRDGSHDASAALAQAGREQADALAALDDPVWQGRAADILDAVTRAQRTLTPAAERPPTLAETLAGASAPAIVIAEDLAPSDTATAPTDRLLGIALAAGGATSHAAILARALGIPAVVGLGHTLFSASAPDGALIALDGGAGEVIAHPDAAQVARAQRAAAQAQAGATAERELATRWRDRRGATADGTAVRTLANASSVTEARMAAEYGAEGIGLLRSEFLFALGETLPDAHTQANLYAEIIEAFGVSRGPITIRTLDAGADKPLPALAPYTSQLAPEANPALGVRGVRISLRFEELLRAQLEGIALAAARTGAHIHVMLPMVAVAQEIEQARQILDLARLRVDEAGLTAPALDLGIMVETPAAALTADVLARHAAFFSIGANDLAQYVMAADRLHPDLAVLRDPAQPALLRAIHATTQAASARKIPVAVCGEMAGDPALAALLVGLGVGELSMAPRRIPAVREMLARHTLDSLHTLAARALAAESSADVTHLLDHLMVGSD